MHDCGGDKTGKGCTKFGTGTTEQPVVIVQIRVKNKKLKAFENGSYRFQGFFLYTNQARAKCQLNTKDLSLRPTVLTKWIN
jgi:hypothetical protein